MTGTVTRTDTSGALTVNLLSDDTSEATVPASVLINDGEMSAMFDITAVNDDLLDGIQTVSVSASATSYRDGIDSINISDDDTQAVIDVRLVRMPTPVSNQGEVAVLPANAEFLDEWEGCLAEIFVSTPDLNNVTLSAASLDLIYDTRYFTAVAVDFSGVAFPNDQDSQIDDPGGRVSGISGMTMSNDVGDDGFSLLARVRFQSLGSDNVLLQTDGQHVQPISDLGFGIENATVSAVDIDSIDVQGGPIPAVELRPVVYDLNDDGSVDFGDFSVFSSVFRSTVENDSPSEVFAGDFNFDDQINFGDFSLFAANFRQTRELGGTRTYSDNFPMNSNNLRLESSSSAPDGNTTLLRHKQLAPIAVEAVRRIEATVGDEIAASLRTIVFEITELPDDVLAQSRSDVILIDADAAGYSWFIDTTPGTDFEFQLADDSLPLVTDLADPAAHRVDLLTVLMHELGHWLGLQHSDQDADLMHDSLPLGVRRVPNAEFTDLSGQGLDLREVDSVFSKFVDNEEFLGV